jgi:2-amino-4-hydroxy-6-hydroxymethyldihydropteridine diphosphokinase
MTAKSNWIFIGLGANLGNREAQLAAAREGLSQLPGWQLHAASSLYETAPWGLIDQPAFLNQVLAIDAAMSPMEFLHAAQALEAALGRVRETHWGPRKIDIDILAWGQQRIQSQRLTIPHPALADRAFVLVPWAEIAPDFHPPGHPATIAELLAALPESETHSVQKTAHKHP